MVWRKNSWFLKSFPKHDVTLVWDDTNKKYQFHKGIINEKTIDIKPEVVKPIKTTKKWYYYTIILSVCVGILSAILIYDNVIKPFLQ